MKRLRRRGAPSYAAIAIQATRRTGVSSHFPNNAPSMPLVDEFMLAAIQFRTNLCTRLCYR